MPQEQRATWAFQWENDLFGKGRTDRYYTNGLRIMKQRPQLTFDSDLTKAKGWTTESDRKVAAALCRWSGCLPPTVHYSSDTYLAQSMYTPRRIDRSEPNPFDRPYAGWLNFGHRVKIADIAGETPQSPGIERQQVLDISLGIVGHASLAGQVQDAWHKLINSDDPQGWDNELKNEPTLQVEYTRRWRLPVASTFDSLPYVRAAVGNVFTYAGVGAHVRWGKNLGGFGHHDAMPSVRRPIAQVMYTPLSTLTVNPPDTVGSPAYVFAGFEGRAVARNIFIDGNTFRDFPVVSRISRKKGVLDAVVGFSVPLGDEFRLTYSHVWRSPEFDVDPLGRGSALDTSARIQRYGVIHLSWSR